MHVDNLSWFPGHMTKTRRMITAEIKNMDAVCEILDARIPLSSRNPDVDELTAGKPKYLPGERASPTQPVPLAPPPLVPQRLGDEDLYAPTPEHLAACREQLATLRNDGLFTPPSLRGSIHHPAAGGGANWSGATWDPSRQLLVVPVQNLAMIVQLEEIAEEEAVP